MMDSKNYLLVDNSNTRTKFLLRKPGGELESRVLATKEINLQNVQRLLEGWQIHGVCMCSVVPEAAQVIRAYAGALPFVELAVDAVSGVDFSTYPGVATLGADRIANVLAAVELLPLPLVAVDMGTATTFDVVVQGAGVPSFIGGVIAPGVAAMAGSLQTRTALLPSLEHWEAGPVIGRNTHEALAAAVRVGYPAMVDSILDEIERELGHEVHVVLTGGDAPMVAERMRRKCRLEPMLTMRGIALVAGFPI